jgi:hypothetical protein
MDKNPHTTPFTVIEGGKAELERKKAKLFAVPELLSDDEFGQLLDELSLSYPEAESLIAKRIRYRAKDPIERNAVLAIINADFDEARRLRNILERRKSLGIKIVNS